MAFIEFAKEYPEVIFGLFGIFLGAAVALRVLIGPKPESEDPLAAPINLMPARSIPLEERYVQRKVAYQQEGDYVWEQPVYEIQSDGKFAKTGTKQFRVPRFVALPPKANDHDEVSHL